MNTYTDLDTWIARREASLKTLRHWRVTSTDNRTLCGVSVQPVDGYRNVWSLEAYNKGQNYFSIQSAYPCKECQEKALRLQTALSRMEELGE